MARGAPTATLGLGGQSGCQGRGRVPCPTPTPRCLPTFPRSCGNPRRSRNSCRGVPRRWWGGPGEAPGWGAGAAPRGAAEPAAAPSLPQNVATAPAQPVPGRPWLISGDAAGDGTSRNGEHRKDPPGGTSAPAGSQRGAGEMDAVGAGQGTGGRRGNRVGTRPQQPEPTARRGRTQPAAGCRSLGGYFGMSISGWLFRGAGSPYQRKCGEEGGGQQGTGPLHHPRYPLRSRMELTAPSPPALGITPTLRPLPQGRDTPKPCQGRGGPAAPALCRALARDRGHGGDSPQPSEPGASLSLRNSPCPAAKPARGSRRGSALPGQRRQPPNPPAKLI